MLKSGFLTIALLLIPATLMAKKEKIVVQLYAMDTEWPATVAISVEVYLILPDGTHVHGQCFKVALDNSRCAPVETFHAETRQSGQCTPKDGPNHGEHCVYQERYKAERNGNDITLFAANGKITFHIDRSW